MFIFHFPYSLVSLFILAFLVVLSIVIYYLL